MKKRDIGIERSNDRCIFIHAGMTDYISEEEKC